MSRPLLATVLAATSLVLGATAQRILPSSDAPVRGEIRAGERIARVDWSEWIPALAFWHPGGGPAVLDGEHAATPTALRGEPRSERDARETSFSERSQESPPASARADRASLRVAWPASAVDAFEHPAASPRSPEPLLLIAAGSAILCLAFLARRRT